MVSSMPFMSNWSLREIGTPWRGPTVLPFFSRYSSSLLACARARSGKNSVKPVGRVKIDDQPVRLA